MRCGVFEFFCFVLFRVCWIGCSDVCLTCVVVMVVVTMMLVCVDWTIADVCVCIGRK